MVGQDTSVLGGIVVVAVLLVANYGFAWLIDRSKLVRKSTMGAPTLLVSNGHILVDNMKHEGITKEELEAVVREHGVASIPEVQTAVFEIDGPISIVGKDNEFRRTKPRRRNRYMQRH